MTYQGDTPSSASLQLCAVLGNTKKTQTNETGKIAKDKSKTTTNNGKTRQLLKQKAKTMKQENNGNKGPLTVT